jgi:hypothetical protein
MYASPIGEPFQVPEVTVPSCEVPVTARLDVVAFVLVEFTVVRFVIVLDAEFAMKPPVKYESPVVVAEPVERFVVEKLEAARVPTFKFVIVEEAELTRMPPLKYDIKVFVAFANVCPAVYVFAVYVFGIVVDAAM